MDEMLEKSEWMISFSLGWETSDGLRLMINTDSTSGCYRLSIKTPSPTIPVAPVMMTFIFMTLTLH